MPPELVEPPGQLGDVALEVADHARLRAATPTEAAATASEVHATQSPSLVNSVRPCRSGTRSARTPRWNRPRRPTIRPVGAMKAETPVLAARTTAIRCSTARNGYIARCCSGPLVRPNHPSFVMFTITRA